MDASIRFKFYIRPFYKYPRLSAGAPAVEAENSIDLVMQFSLLSAEDVTVQVMTSYCNFIRLDSVYRPPICLCYLSILVDLLLFCPS